MRHHADVAEQPTAPPWEAAHRAACEAGQRQYRDPETGYRVFTELGLKERGSCCGCGCRHCPWSHEAVPEDLRAVRIARPAWLHGGPDAGSPITADESVDVVFWSGGKDSFLAARAVLRRQPKAGLILLTTFGQKTRVVAHQELPIQNIIAQARALDRPLVGVPLYPMADYSYAIAEALRFVASHTRVRSLVFGDLHLEHIRAWREDQLLPIADELGATLQFPLWGADYAALTGELQASGVVARVCASPDYSKIAPVAHGDRFDAELIARLPVEIDAFGECGEFHTEVLSAGLTPQHLR